MKLIRNFLALIGLLAIVAGTVGYFSFQSFAARLDPEAFGMYQDVGGRFLESLDPGTAFVRVVKVEDGMTTDDVEEVLESVAVELELLYVGKSPFYKQVEAVTGESYRYITFFSFCDARVGAEMADYNNTYTAFMPCRIALVEDPDGSLSLHMMDLDMLIYGGKPLPPELKAGAIKVRDKLNTLMERAAAGDF